MSALSEIRASLRPQGAPAAPGGLLVGAWCPPGTVPGFWGPLVAPCGHPGEADALVTLGDASGAPVALLRRRWHLPDPRDAEPLPPVPLFELLSPGGRDRLSALAAEPLLDELVFRLAPQGGGPRG
jgi:hypothetical protein